MKRRLLIIIFFLLIFCVCSSRAGAEEYYLPEDVDIGESITLNGCLFLSGSKNGNAYLCCLNERFETLWEQELGGSEQDYYTALAGKDDIVVAVGYGKSKDGDFAGVSHDTLWESELGDQYADDAIITSFRASTGEVLWTQCVGTPCGDQFLAVSFAPDGSLNVFGHYSAPNREIYPIDTEESFSYYSGDMRYVFDAAGGIVREDISPAPSLRSYYDALRFTEQTLIVSSQNVGTIYRNCVWVFCESASAGDRVVAQTDSTTSQWILFAGDDMFLARDGGNYIPRKQLYISLKPVVTDGAESSVGESDLGKIYTKTIFDIEKKKNGNYVILGKGTSEQYAANASDGTVILVSETTPTLEVLSTQASTDKIDGMFLFNGRLYFTNGRRVFTELSLESAHENEVSYYTAKAERNYEPVVEAVSNILSFAGALLVPVFLWFLDGLHCRRQKKIRKRFAAVGGDTSSAVVVNNNKGRLLFVEALALLSSALFNSHRLAVLRGVRDVLKPEELRRAQSLLYMQYLLCFVLFFCVFVAGLLLFRAVVRRYNKYNLHASFSITDNASAGFKWLLAALLVLATEALAFMLVIYCLMRLDMSDIPLFLTGFALLLFFVAGDLIFVVRILRKQIRKRR